MASKVRNKIFLDPIKPFPETIYEAPAEDEPAEFDKDLLIEEIRKTLDDTVEFIKRETRR